MKGSEMRLIEYMDGSKKRFIIPVYQRNYDWKTENCKQLYDDLIKTINNNRKSHFFGSIVSVNEPSGRYTELLIIDGQQRLTTVSLLFLAMYKLLVSGTVKSQDESLSRQIYEDFLVDKFQPEETRMKLKPIKNDQQAFSKLFDESDEYIKDSNLTTNYNYFFERIQKEEITIDELYDAICKLQIINIELNNDDNPQLIFESLNSTGLDLTEGDKIRNYILMGLSAKEQEEYYDKYWNKIEIYTDYNVSAFVKDYLCVKQYSTTQKKVYITFKEYVEELKLNTEDLLKDLLAYAKRYNILLGGKTESKVLNACISRLNRLETTVTRPFFLEVLRLKDENKLTINQVTDIFLISENYIFRRFICGLPTNALNKIFSMLHKEITRYDGTDENYVEKFKYALLSKKEKAAYPNDADFADAFTTSKVYLMNSKNKIYILERLENFGTNEDKDIYSHCDDGTYSIEHIMPQHLTPEWANELGENYEEIHNEWLHRIANLTLTAYNSKYSNSSFTEKKNTKNGFIESGIRMNTYIATKDKWTEKELKERSEYLKNKALQIWNYPTTTFRPKEKQLDYVTLADDDTESLVGRAVVKFRFKNTEQPVKSWVEMYVKVLKILYSENKNPINKLAAADGDGLASHFSFCSKQFNKSEEIGDGIYVFTNTNTQNKINVLTKIFDLYELDQTDLLIYLKDNDENYDDETGTRFEARRKYWTYALEIIKEENENNGMFCKTKATKDNWINCNIGIKNLYISCVSNQNSARVELNFFIPDKEINHTNFNIIKKDKESIEKELEINLIWDIDENKKSCKVYYELKNVSINNEHDWEKIAHFQAEWVKKFYDVFTPYLKKLL